MEPEDLEELYQWENNTELWEVSGTMVPFSKKQLEQFIEDSQYDIFTLKQMRFMICLNANRQPVGTLDLFECDFLNKRAGVGVLIAHKEERKKGRALEALLLLEGYCREVLRLKQLYCTVNSTNTPSVNLFQKAGYRLCGVKKSWIKASSGYCDAHFYQLLLK